MAERRLAADATLARRARAQWPLLVAVLAALVTCSSLVGVTALLLTEGQHRALAAAIVEADGAIGSGSPDLVTAGIQVSPAEDGAPTGTTALVDSVTSAMVDSVRPYAATTSTWAASPMMFLPGEVVRQGYLLDADSATTHARLVAGRWPAATAAGSPVEVALPTTTAAAIGLGVGSSVRLSDTAPHPNAPQPSGVDVVVVGTFAPDGSSAWARDVLGGAGLEVAATWLPVYGPFLVAPGALVGADRPVSWLSVVLDPTLTVDTPALPHAVAAVGALPETLKRVVGPRIDSVTARSGLGTILARDRAEQNLTAAIMLVVALLICALGVATLGLVGRLVDQRRSTETAMLIARGASRSQLAGRGAVEALVLAGVASVIATPLALAGYRALVTSAPLGRAWQSAEGLGSPTLGWRVVAAVVLGAALPAATLVVIGLRRAPSRASRRTGRVFARSGADVLLVAVAAMSYVQLRAHHIGTGAIDPVLVVAPVLCLVAGAILALRVLPLVGRLAEAGARRGKGLVFPLAGWQVARGRATSGALLVVLASSSAAFGVIFLGTWHGSQGDQADAQLGADVVVGAPGAPDTGMRLADATGNVVMPVTNRRVMLGSRPGGAQLVGLDTTKAAQVMRGRLPGGETWAAATAGLAPESPVAALAVTGGGTGALGLTIDGRVGGTSLDAALALPAHLVVTPTLILADDVGNHMAVEGAPVTIDGTPHDVALSAANLDSLVHERWRVIAIDLTLGVEVDRGVPFDFDGPLSAELSVHVAGAEASPGQWYSQVIGVPPLVQVVSTDRAGTTVNTRLSSTIFSLAWSGTHVMLLGFPPVEDLPVVVSSALADELGVAEGDRLSLTSDQGTVTGRVVRGVPYVAGAPDGAVILADSDALARALLSAGGNAVTTDGWWAADPSGAAEARVADLGLAPIQTRAAVASALRDGPLRVALRVALGVLVGAAVILALAGTAAQAASMAQNRATEIARLRGIGASRRVLGVTAVLQHGAVTSAAVVVGAMLGAVLAWFIGPALIVGAGGLPAVPAAVVVWSWGPLVAVLATLALGGTIVAIPAVRGLVGRDAAASLRMGDES